MAITPPTASQQHISSEYGQAVSGKKQGIVTATGGGQFADYSTDDLSVLPTGMEEMSFGCGNPLAFAAVQPGQTVLDLGCGAGLDLILAAEKVGTQGRVIGVDMTVEMVGKAKENIAESVHSNIDVRHGLIEALPVDSQSVDWVISNCVINLAPDKPMVFAEIARVLKPGGRMLVSDIVAENLPFWVRRSGLLTVACAAGAISESDYLTGLAAAGLSECEVLGRERYSPEQLAGVVLDVIPKPVANISCCGHSIAGRLLKRLARPVSDNLWSARFSARKPSSIDQAPD